MKILICDDHAIFRAGVRTVLEDLGVDADLADVGDAETAMAVVDSGGIDLVLLDLELPGIGGWEALRRMRTEHSDVPVVIISASENPEDVRRALAGGASGYIPKTQAPAVLRSALELVISGNVYVPPQVLPSDGVRARRRGERYREGAARLTPRQHEVLQHMSRGLTNREIARVLGVAEATVKAHLGAIFDALDVSNRTEAALVMRELGLEDGEDPSS